MSCRVPYPPKFTANFQVFFIMTIVFYEFVKFYLYPHALVCCTVCNWISKLIYIIQSVN